MDLLGSFRIISHKLLTPYVGTHSIGHASMRLCKRHTQLPDLHQITYPHLLPVLANDKPNI